MSDDEDQDVYADEYLEELGEGDEIDPFEEGFMRGHNKAEKVEEEEEE